MMNDVSIILHYGLISYQTYSFHDEASFDILNLDRIELFYWIYYIRDMWVTCLLDLIIKKNLFDKFCPMFFINAEVAQKIVLPLLSELVW